MFFVSGLFRKLLRGVLPVLMLLALAACQPGGGTGPIFGSGATVPVALLVPYGSARPGDKVLARSLENAARLAVTDLRGVKIDLRVYPTAGAPAQAANAARKAVAAGARIILGPVFAASAKAAGAAVAGRNINVLSFSNNAAIAGGNLFVLGNTYANTSRRLLSYAVAQGYGRIVVVHDQTSDGAAALQAVQSGAGRAGATILATSSYEFSQKGVVSAIPAIAQTITTSGANAVVFTADTAGALPLLVQLLPENGIDPKAVKFIGLTRWDIPTQTLSLPGLQGGWFALPDPSLTQGFTQRYSSAYGSVPNPIAGLAYDGIAAIGALVKTGKSNALSRSALTQPAGFAGVSGVFRLLADGTNERALAIAQITNRQVQIIDPAPKSFGHAGL